MSKPAEDYVDLWLATRSKELPSADIPTLAIISRISRAGLFLELPMEREVGTHGLTIDEFWVLAELRRFGHRTPTQLYKALVTPASAMTRRVDRLVKLGLVKRTSANTDKRSVTLSLTARGREITGNHFNVYTSVEREIAREFSKKERTVLAELLRRLLPVLERSCYEIPASSRRKEKPNGQ